MKRLLIGLFMMLWISPGQLGYGMTFKVKVDYRGRLSLEKNNEKIRDSSTTVLDLRKNEPIVFILENRNKKTIILNIKGQKGQVKLDTSDFYYSRSISTDENLILASKKETTDLHEKFTLFCGYDTPYTFYSEFLVRIIPEQVVASPLVTPMNDGRTGPGKESESTPENKYKPGSMVYDALTLLEPEKHNYNDFIQIMRFYFGDTLTINEAIIKNLIKDNPFLNRALDTNLMFRFKQTAKARSEELPGTSSFSFSSIGGLDVTNIADGLAKFLVKRTKQELSIAFFERFKTALNDSSKAYKKDLKTIFPATCNLLNIIDKEVYDYQKYIQNLRAVFMKDLTDLNKSLPKIVDNHKDMFQAKPEIKALLLSGCYIAGALENRVHPADILVNYPDEYLNGLDKNFQAALRTLQLLSESLRDTTTGDAPDYWVNLKQVRGLVNNKTTFQVYLGLLYQQAKRKSKPIEYEGKTLVKIMDDLAPHYNESYENYKKFIFGLAEKTVTLNKMIIEYNQPVQDSTTFELYAKFFNKTVGLIEYCTTIGELPFFRDIPALNQLPVKTTDYFSVSYSACDLAIDINRKNYSSAINHFLNIYQVVIAKQDIKSTEILHKIARYGSLAAAVATAKNSDEVETVIVSFALPAGSSRIKRETPFNISLNAYCGLFLGYEQIKGIDPPWTWGYQKFNSFGVAAPVGIAISRGHSVFFFGTGETGWTKDKYGWAGWSSSVFVSLIDIGALAAFRFTDDSTKNAPTILLQDIISPGLFLSLGIPQTPLSINIGWQIGPILRNVTAKTTEYKNNYTRISISVCVDIPILNFYNTSKKD
jgi:hypothetical protein